jgi:hypothetical protein|tara:strand:+ start:16989 stop:17522 length:534 start_codon:yes stop_codon:yes gene_type:complete
MKDLRSIYSEFSEKNSNKKFFIFVSIPNQNLILYKDFVKIKEYNISSSKYGEGSIEGSYKTPLGAHIIKKYIGENEDIYTIFKNRKPTQHKLKIEEDKIFLEDDIISSRILWLEGLEAGKNKGSNLDSFKRYIYIHGTHEEAKLGEKASHGCIRMGNNDIIDLCNRDIINTLVYISN